jgi:transposase
VGGECSVTHNGADFLRFLQLINRSYRKRDLHVILDNSSTHSTSAVLTWLVAHPRVHFHFTPTGASWLNMVEAWFSILTRKSVRRGSFDTVKALFGISRTTSNAGTSDQPLSFGLRTRPPSLRRQYDVLVNITFRTEH